MTTKSVASVGFDVEGVRRDFPILQSRVHGKPLVYLDNAATSQKPQSVIDALVKYYTEQNSNIHRGVHYLSEWATREYEGARGKVRRFLNAAEEREIIFVRQTTEGLNLVASSYGRSNLKAGDEVLITGMEHHSNIVPWQMICEQTGAKLRVVPITDEGELRLDEYARLLTPRTKIVAVAHISNSLGTINPIKELARLAHQQGAVVVVDGAQAAPHLRVDVRDLGVDFYAFSGHKLFGPTGIGALYGKRTLLEAMPPYQGGGSMIHSVTFEKTLYADLPDRFEAGTPHIAGAIGLGVAIDYVQALKGAEAYEQELLRYGTEVLRELPRVRLIGTAKHKASILSFVLEGIHPHDIGTVLDGEGIAIRTGHHCTQPVMERFGIPATSRASLAFYNTKQEIDALAKGIHKVIEVLS